MRTYPCPAVIFDMDGTLLDTITDIAESMNAVLTRLGLPVHPIGRYLDFVGEGIEILAMRALPEGQRRDSVVAAAVDAMREEYSSRWSVSSRPYEGIPELLDGLERRGIMKSILTNKTDAFAKAMAAALLSRWSFANVRGLVPGCPRKPDPAGAILCAGVMQVSPQRCIFVGDSAIDMETAHRAGMAPFGVLWGYQDRERLLASGAKVILEDPLDLLRYMD